MELFGADKEMNYPNPKIEYVEDTSGEFWWCNTHRRKATHIIISDSTYHNGRHVCVGPGIMIPCSCVDLTNDIEVLEYDDT